MPAFCPFPGEILDSFVDSLGSAFKLEFNPRGSDTRPALIACLSVSRSFRYRARRYLFSFVDLNPGKPIAGGGRRQFSFFELAYRLRQLTDGTSSATGIAPLIRRLDIPSPGPNCVIDNPNLTTVLQRVLTSGQLEQLSLGTPESPIVWSSLSIDLRSALVHLVHSSTLTSLVLSNIAHLPDNILHGTSLHHLTATKLWALEHHPRSLAVPPARMHQVNTELSALNLFYEHPLAVDDAVLKFDIQNGLKHAHNFLSGSAKCLRSLTLEFPEVYFYATDMHSTFQLSDYVNLKGLTISCVDVAGTAQDDFGGMRCLPAMLTATVRMLQTLSGNRSLNELMIELMWDTDTDATIDTLRAPSEWAALDDLCSQKPLSDVPRLVLQLVMETSANGMNDLVRDFIKQAMPKATNSGHLDVSLVILEFERMDDSEY